MKDIGYEDVPSTVWDKVYKKWKFAAENGWTYALWHWCPLCDYVMRYSWFRRTATKLHLISFGGMCPTCPIYKRRWCQSASNKSKLHIDYLGDEDRWKEDVSAFLQEIKPYTSMEPRN